jgi:hypothetical protein
MPSVSAIKEETQAPAHLTETIADKLKNPSTSSDFDLHAGVNQVLADVGMSAADSGGQLTFYGQDPIVPSRIRFATTAGIGLAAKTIAAAAIGETEPSRARTFMSTSERRIDASAASSMGSGRP